MTKKTMRLISFLIIVLTIISCVGMVLAAVPTPNSIKPDQNTNITEVTDVGSRVMTVIQTVGVVIAVVVLSILGIKFMMGSAEEKAEYKKTFIPYIIGAVLIFAASTLANMVYQFATGIRGNDEASAITIYQVAKSMIAMM